MHVSSDDVAQIVHEVWSSMLGLDITPVDMEVTPGHPSVAGSVGVTGAVECLISLEMSEAGARQVASAMFGLAATDVSDDDVGDSIGELTNMVGGNVKNLLPAPSTLSLPVVAQGRIPTLKVFGGSPLLHQTFYSGDSHPVIITVFHRST